MWTESSSSSSGQASPKTLFMTWWYYARGRSSTTLPHRPETRDTRGSWACSCDSRKYHKSSTSQQKHANFGSDTWSVKKDICELLNDPSIKKIITKLQNFCKTARTTAPSSGADDSYWHTSAVQLKTKLYIKKRLWLDQLEKCNVALC